MLPSPKLHQGDASTLHKMIMIIVIIMMLLVMMRMMVKIDFKRMGHCPNNLEAHLMLKSHLSNNLRLDSECSDLRIVTCHFIGGKALKKMLEYEC